MYEVAPVNEWQDVEFFLSFVTLEKDQFKVKVKAFSALTAIKCAGRFSDVVCIVYYEQEVS